MIVNRLTTITTVASLTILLFFHGFVVVVVVGALTQTKPSTNFRSRHWKDQPWTSETPQILNQIAVEIKDISKSTTTSSPPQVTNLHHNKDGKVIAVEISCAISERQAATVQALAQTIRNKSKLSAQLDMYTLFQHRSFGENQGGNDCTYLAPLLQNTCPEIAHQVLHVVTLAWEKAGWNQLEYPIPTSLGIRTSEHLCYQGWKSLQPHKDVGSTFTTMIALTDPNRDYEGGAFFVANSMLTSTDIKPERLSAVVFLSDTIHGVRAITEGHRQSFVTELWQHDDAPLGMNRPTPEEWQAFLKKE